MDTSERFDLIVIRHVLEHFEEPGSILHSLASRLTPQGALLIVVPNIDCIGRKVFDVNWSWFLPWHCNFFNPASLRTFLKACDYSIAKLYQMPSPLWYPESFKRRFPCLGKYFNGGPLAMSIFGHLIGMGLIGGFSDNITALARPVKRVVE
jgi:SAM-dependent methyltransferase